MAFTPTEKVHVKRYVDGMEYIYKAVRSIADVAGVKGHILRQDIGGMVGAYAHIFFEMSRNFFAHISGSAQGNIDRAVFIENAKRGHLSAVQRMNGIISSKTLPPDFNEAVSLTRSARDIIAGFDWSLPYSNPRHDNNPNTPFDESLTVVGPHGSWSEAMEGLRFVVWYHGLMWMHFNDFFKGYIPIYVEESNGPLKELLYSIAHIAETTGRVYSMHTEVEHDDDRAAIDADHANDSGARPREFHRAMRQNELMFNVRHSEGKNWHGRDFALGGAASLEMRTLERFFLPLAKANGPEWTWQMVIHETDKFGGKLIHPWVTLSDYWQVYDSWALSALGFVHAMPAPTVFVPKVQTPGGIPAGFFDEQVADLEEQKSALQASSLALNQVRAELQGLEGGAI